MNGPTTNITGNGNDYAVKLSNLDRHIAWLRQHHDQSAGAARNLRKAAALNLDKTVAASQNKAADGSAQNAAHFHEIAEMLTQLQTARKVLRKAESSIANLPFATAENARRRYIETLDRLFGL